MTSDSDNRGQELLDLVRWQLHFGARCPGTNPHTLFREALFQWLGNRALRLGNRNLTVRRQEFTVTLYGRRVSCSNLMALLESRTDKRSGTLLLGTHFDTRPIADREHDTLKSKTPIPGANDGGSGTAVLLHLLDQISSESFSRDILFVFFDAEDVGNLDGNRFAMGSRHFADHPDPVSPEEVIILDMVGGRNMIMNIDAHIYHHRESLRLTGHIMKLAGSLNLTAFERTKKNKTRFIVSDHIPFLLKGIPSCVLIDIDYPEWHTQRDLPDAMSPESLVMIEDLLLSYLKGFRS